MEHKKFLVFMVAAAMIATAASLWAQGPKKEVPIPTPKVVTLDGAVLYDAYCATCHGPAGRGNGPLSRRVDHKVPDLTLLAERDHGFNRQHVLYHIVDQRTEEDLMPNWVRFLRQTYAMDEATAWLAASHITRHLETLQVPNTLKAR